MNVSELVVLPTQRVVARFEAPAGGWVGVSPWTFTMTGVDGLNGQTFEGTCVVTGKHDAAVVRCGPFMVSGEATLEVAVLDGGGGHGDSWSDTVVITNSNSPSTIVRQALFDLLEAAATGGTLGGALVLSDGMYRPEVAVEDTPYGGGVTVEIGGCGGTRGKVSVVRAGCACECELRVRCAGESLSAGLVGADNVSWLVQKVVDGSTNMGLSGIGVIDWSWGWDVQIPEGVECEGSPIPIVEQELRFRVMVNGVN